MCQMGIFSILEFYLTHLTIGWSILSTAHARQCGTARMMAISKACALTVVAQQVTAQLSVRRKAESAWQPVRFVWVSLGDAHPIQDLLVDIPLQACKSRSH